MHFHFLSSLALTSFLFFTPSLTSPSDILYIQKLTADFAINLDTKNVNGYDVEFLPKATYNPGNGPVKGIAAIKDILGRVTQNATTQTSITTQSINLGPPFDAQGAAATATGITYAIVTNLGTGDEEGKAFIVYGYWTDKLVKTGDFANYGGWRFSDRVFKSLVSFMLLAMFYSDCFPFPFFFLFFVVFFSSSSCSSF